MKVDSAKTSLWISTFFLWVCVWSWSESVWAGMTAVFGVWVLKDLTDYAITFYKEQEDEQDIEL